MKIMWRSAGLPNHWHEMPDMAFQRLIVAAFVDDEAIEEMSLTHKRFTVIFKKWEDGDAPEAEPCCQGEGHE